MNHYMSNFYSNEVPSIQPAEIHSYLPGRRVRPAERREEDPGMNDAPGDAWRADPYYISTGYFDSSD
jgi:hypothetical protein